jgi:hypothetical protein
VDAKMDVHRALVQVAKVVQVGNARH